jgi:uncharacterized protein (DUF305 family)
MHDLVRSPTLALALLLACTHAGAAQDPPRTVQPGAPGDATKVLDSDDLATMERPTYSEADVRFMHGMIPHHAQALEMVALIGDRTDSEAIRRLGQRIQISQTDEIALMEHWLQQRGEATGRQHGPGAHDGMTLMPGMLTAEQMAQLDAARGAEFDRLFLELMIMHHEGALVMVKQLFSSPGGGQGSAIYQFASDVDADQEMEIRRRMRQMLDASR